MKPSSTTQEALVAALGDRDPRELEHAEQVIHELADLLLALVERAFVDEQRQQARAAFADALEAALVEAKAPGFVPPRRPSRRHDALPTRRDALVSGFADLIDFFPDGFERRAG